MRFVIHNRIGRHVDPYFLVVANCFQFLNESGILSVNVLRIHQIVVSLKLKVVLCLKIIYHRIYLIYLLSQIAWHTCLTVILLLCQNLHHFSHGLFPLLELARNLLCNYFYVDKL